MWGEGLGVRGTLWVGSSSETSWRPGMGEAKGMSKGVTLAEIPISGEYRD